MENELSTASKIVIVSILIVVVIGFVAFAIGFYMNTTDAEAREFENNANKPKASILSNFDGQNVSGEMIRQLVLKSKHSQSKEFTTVIQNDEQTYCYGKGVSLTEDLRPKYFKGEQRGNSCRVLNLPNPSYQSHLKPFNDYMSAGYVSPGNMYESNLIYDEGGKVIGVVLIQL